MIGVGPGDEPTPMETDDKTDNSSNNNINNNKGHKYYIDSTVLGRPREKVEMKTPLTDGIGMYMYMYSF